MGTEGLNLNPSVPFIYSSTQHRVVALEHHALAGVGGVAAGTALSRFSPRCLEIGRGVVTEVEEPPTVGRLETCVVFHHHVHTLKLAREETATRRCVFGSILVITLLQQHQFLGDNRPVGKLTGPLVDGERVRVSVGAVAQE